MTVPIDYEWREKVNYAFGHAVASFTPHAHSADSADVARDILNELQLSTPERILFWLLAEYVEGNHQYTGEAELALAKIKRGES